MDCQLTAIILIMLLTGIFGGWVNYLQSFDVKDTDPNAKYRWLKYIASGICASFLVPAFLKMIASNLITNPTNEAYLVFTGFCLVAAIFSRRFIFTIGEKILEKANKAQQDAKKAIEKTN